MVNQLTACSLAVEEPTVRAQIVKRLRDRSPSPLLVLDTCQRFEVFGTTLENPASLDDNASVLEVHEELHAIRHLARIAAGLESRIIGELEILGQVREAYKLFETKYGKEHPRLSRVFQDSIAIARRARRESGVDQTLTGLGALSARTVMEKVSDQAQVAVVGSGSLAKSVARYLGKRSQLPVRVSSRCPEHAMKLAIEVGGFSSGLDELAPMLSDAKAIVTATAAPHPLIYPHHLPALPNGEQRLIIDLGEPADCNEEVRSRSDVDYIGLLDVEGLAQTNTSEREARGKIAARLIDDAVAQYRV